MWRNLLVYTGCERGLFYNLPEPEPRHKGTPVRYKKVVAALILENKGSGCLYIGLNFLFCLLAKRDESLFVSFTYNSDKSSAHVARRQR